MGSSEHVVPRLEHTVVKAVTALTLPVFIVEISVLVKIGYDFGE